MKLPILCSQCMVEDATLARAIAAVEIRNDGRYEVICSKGHKSVTILQQQKFEVLFDIGANAILDAYYREAVSSFTSSLERFYEFVIMAVLFDKGISEEAFNQAWELVERQSPRQLGAFIFIYLTEFGIPPILLARKKVDFRDEVIHQGRIPTRQEALDYGQAILDIVRPILKQVKEKYPNGVNKTVFQHLKECRSTENDKCQVSTMFIRTILSLAVAEPGYDERSLEGSLADLRQWRLNPA
jgi:hypothetical protein